MISDSIIDIFKLFIPLFVVILAFLLIELIVIIVNKNKYNYLKKNISYNREFPFDGNLDITYFILSYYSNIDKNKLLSNLIGAYLLRWENNGHIKITNDNNNYKIDLGDGDWPKTMTEERLYNYLKEAALDDNTISEKELKKWCYAFKHMLRYWSNNIMNDALEELKSQGLVSYNIKSIYTAIRGQKVENPKLNKKYQEILGFKKFLKDFSNMESKKYLEVHLWEEFLVYGELFGIATDVSKQFSEIYPKFSYKTKVLNVIPFTKLFEKAIISSLKTHLIASFIAVIVIFTELYISKMYDNIIKYLYLCACTYFILYKSLTNYYINRLQIKYKKLTTKIMATITKANTIYGYRRLPDKQEIYYEFIIDDYLYTGYDVFNVSSHKLKVGNKIKVLYNPNNPNKKETQKTLNKHNIVYLLKSIIIYIILIFPVIYYFK